MKKILFVTLYDMICIGQRLLSSVAREQGIESHVVVFKDQKTRPIIRDSRDHSVYQLYVDGVKYGSCYAAYPYTKKEVKLFVELVGRVQPDVICLSTRAFGYSCARELIGAVRARYEIPVVGGGWGPTLDPARFLEFCDYVCFGEGEKSIVEMCRILTQGETNFDSVPSFVYLRDGAVVRNPVAKPIDNKELDALPYPDFDPENKALIDNDSVVTDFYNEKIYNCLAGRGCPLNCTYCMSNQYRELYRAQGHQVRKHRLRNVESVLRELEIQKARGAIYVRFVDEVFPSSRRWMNQFLEEYPARVGLPFFAYVRPEFHPDSTVRQLQAAGLTTTVVGIQSGARQIREKVFRRRLSPERLVSFANTLQEIGVDFSYHLINFNPFEREGHMVETLRFLRRLPFAPLTVFKLVPFAGAPIYQMIEDEAPVMLSPEIQKRYGYLYSMTTRSPAHRKLAELVHLLNLFSSNPMPLALFSIPSFVQLHSVKLLRKWRYGASTLIQLPIRARSRDEC